MLSKSVKLENCPSHPNLKQPTWIPLYERWNRRKKKREKYDKEKEKEKKRERERERERD